jgi:hypothetical protein
MPAPTTAPSSSSVAPDGGDSGDPFTGDNDCATRVVQGTDMTVLGGALYDQFTAGSYTGELDYHHVGQWGSTRVNGSGISTIDIDFAGTPFVELSRGPNSKHCTPQVRFALDVHLWSEGDVSDGKFIAHGYWTVDSVRFEIDELVSAFLAGPLEQSSGLQSDARFAFTFDLKTGHGKAALGDGRSFFDWTPFCRDGAPDPNAPSLTDPNAKDCGLIWYSDLAPPLTSDDIAKMQSAFNCAQAAFGSKMNASLVLSSSGAGATAKETLSSLPNALAGGRAPYLEADTESGIGRMGGGFVSISKIRRCQSISVNQTCKFGDPSATSCATCVSPGNWIPMCAAAPFT